MGELEHRVRQAAQGSAFEVRALSPREAIKAERADRRAEAAVEQQRIETLWSILASFRVALRERDDIGTRPFGRAKRSSALRKAVQSAFGFGPRGWIVGRLDAEVVLPGPYAGATRLLDLSLVMLLDGKLYCCADGDIWDRYRLGQTDHPDMPVVFPQAVWRELEDTVPEHVGHLVGVFELEWRLD